MKPRDSSTFIRKHCGAISRNIGCNGFVSAVTVERSFAALTFLRW